MNAVDMYEVAVYIILNILASVMSLENSKLTTQHDLSPQRIVLHNINSSSSGIPLVILRENLKRHAICLPNATIQQQMRLSLIVCRQLGYDALQRFYSMQDSTFNNRGLLPSINCINRQADMEACLWKSPRKIACDTYLGVHCSRCNYEIEIADNTKKEIEFPAYMPCFPNVLCEWNIFNNHKRKKITVLEFKNNKNLNMESGNALSYKPGQIIEILWYDIATHQWSRIRESFFRFVNIGIIKIESSNITIKYFFVDCSFFDSTVKETEIIPSMAYYNEEYTLQTSGGASYFLPVLYCLLCVFVVGTFIFCLCFYVKRKRLTKSQPCYTLTYMPGINISFEDEEQCKGKLFLLLSSNVLQL
ncbi:uncharacterized protein [Periplaneta americana]|uniref:uncharacterized protein n=1 Tax=Periplaneta americana TaxID=6978 RepID=UPI0037E72700